MKHTEIDRDGSQTGNAGSGAQGAAGTAGGVGMNIPFSPPDVTEAEISAVADAMRSGWITTGPRVKELERRIAAYCGTPRAVCLNSGTSAIECALRVLDIHEGDEVIVPAYTYTATVSPVVHVGATPVMVDCAPGTYEMDYGALADAITGKTKAIIPVDLGGIVCDYDTIFGIVEDAAPTFEPNNPLQEVIGRIAVVTDGAHALGAGMGNTRCGAIADFTAFSFHAVKNLTTAEGGALTWRHIGSVDDEEIYHRCQLFSLHGQDKDALAKTRAGAWEYDVISPDYKWNMTDISAAMGLVQLDRYPTMLARREEILHAYGSGLLDGAGAPSFLGPAEKPGQGGTDGDEGKPRGSVSAAPCPKTQKLPLVFLPHFAPGRVSSKHLMLVRMPGWSCEDRNALIVKMAERGVATNVHYKPLPMMTAYRKLGFDIARYPNAYAQFACEITLPLFSTLTDEQVAYVIDAFNASYEEIAGRR